MDDESTREHRTRFLILLKLRLSDEGGRPGSRKSGILAWRLTQWCTGGSAEEVQTQRQEGVRAQQAHLPGVAGGDVGVAGDVQRVHADEVDLLSRLQCLRAEESTGLDLLHFRACPTVRFAPAAGTDPLMMARSANELCYCWEVRWSSRADGDSTRIPHGVAAAVGNRATSGATRCETIRNSGGQGFN